MPLTEPEVRRLLIAIAWPRLRKIEHTLLWSQWRRHHQAVAQRCHYHERAAPDPHPRL